MDLDPVFQELVQMVQAALGQQDILISNFMTNISRPGSQPISPYTARTRGCRCGGRSASGRPGQLAGELGGPSSADVNVRAQP
ncbi:hypothetical protein VTN02DRAFT_1502 [Thermoascus thermophilus]